MAFPGAREKGPPKCAKMRQKPPWEIDREEKTVFGQFWTDFGPILNGLNQVGGLLLGGAEEGEGLVFGSLRWPEVAYGGLRREVYRRKEKKG